jgi:hypothetical protein
MENKRKSTKTTGRQIHKSTKRKPSKKTQSRKATLRTIKTNPASNAQETKKQTQSDPKATPKERPT